MYNIVFSNTCILGASLWISGFYDFWGRRNIEILKVGQGTFCRSNHAIVTKVVSVSLVRTVVRMSFSRQNMLHSRTAEATDRWARSVCAIFCHGNKNKDIKFSFALFWYVTLCIQSLLPSIHVSFDVYPLGIDIIRTSLSFKQAWLNGCVPIL